MSSEPTLNVEIDERLTNALSASNYRISLSNQRKNSKLKLQRSLTFSKNGGTFYISQELMSFINCLMMNGKETTILLDINDNPIEIKNVEEFFSEIYDRYYQTMNDYLIQYKEMQKARNVKKLIFGDN